MKRNKIPKIKNLTFEGLKTSWADVGFEPKTIWLWFQHFDLNQNLFECCFHTHHIRSLKQPFNHVIKISCQWCMIIWSKVWNHESFFGNDEKNPIGQIKIGLIFGQIGSDQYCQISSVCRFEYPSQIKQF